MEEVGAFEAKNKLAALLQRAERGEEILITRHGRPVAKLVPAGPDADREAARAAARDIRALAREMDLQFDWQEWKRLRDEGRR